MLLKSVDKIIVFKIAENLDDDGSVIAYEQTIAAKIAAVVQMQDYCDVYFQTPFLIKGDLIADDELTARLIVCKDGTTRVLVDIESEDGGKVGIDLLGEVIDVY